MTEREKRIEEITTLLCSEKACSQEYCKKAQKDKQRYCCLTLNGVERLYNAGYRKEEEVRKEAIKEFIETVKRCLPNEPYLHTHIRAIASIKFGVEVEE